MPTRLEEILNVRSSKLSPYEFLLMDTITPIESKNDSVDDTTLGINVKLIHLSEYNEFLYSDDFDLVEGRSIIDSDYSIEMSLSELGYTTIDSIKEFAIEFNIKEWKRMIKTKEEIVEQINQYPDSNDFQNYKKYLDTVFSKYYLWLKNKKYVDTNNSESTLKQKKEFKRNMKEECRKIYETLLNENKIDKEITESKSEPNISNLVIPELEKEFNVTNANKRSIKDYFKKGLIKAKKKGGKYIAEAYVK